jgi:hypothetical protein
MGVDLTFRFAATIKTTAAQAPRRADERIDGRSPGSRVGTVHAFPGETPVA